MLVTLVRHGEVEGRRFVFRGASDPPLSAVGWRELHDITSWLATPPPTRVVSSPSQRCRAFAELFAREHGCELVIERDLRELDFGAWEELTPAEVADRDGATLAAFRANPHDATPPGGEPYAAFLARVRAAFARLPASRHVAVITHAGVMRALIADWLGLPPTHLSRIALGPASTCRVSLGEAPIVLSLDSRISCVD